MENVEHQLSTFGSSPHQQGARTLEGRSDRRASPRRRRRASHHRRVPPRKPSMSPPRDAASFLPRFLSVYQFEQCRWVASRKMLSLDPHSRDLKREKQNRKQHTVYSHSFPSQKSIEKNVYELKKYEKKKIHKLVVRSGD